MTDNNKCLFCLSDVGDVQVIQEETTTAGAQTDFSKLYSVFDIDNEGQSARCWDSGENKSSPICSTCNRKASKLCEQWDMMESLRREVSSTLAHLSAVVIESEVKDKGSFWRSGDGGGLSERSDNDYEYFRSSIIQRYSPAVAVQRHGCVGSKRFKEKLTSVGSHRAAMTTVSRSSLWNMDEQLHETSQLPRKYDTAMGYDSDEDSLGSVPGYSPAVSGADEDSSSENSSSPRDSRNKSRRNKDDARVVVVDKTTKTYAIAGFEFVEVEEGFKCSTCDRLFRFRLTTSRKARRFDNIRQHINNLHKEKSGLKVVLQNEETMTYAYGGFEFQTVENGYRCSICDKVCKATHSMYKDSSFGYIRQHIDVQHRTGGHSSNNSITHKLAGSSHHEGTAVTDSPVATTVLDVNEVEANTSTNVTPYDARFRAELLRTLKDWKEVELVDLDTKTFSINGLQVREVETGFKCLTCFKVFTIPAVSGIRVRFSLVKLHINTTHKDPKRKNLVTLLDEETMTYSVCGFKFQKVDDGYQCLTCKRIFPAAQKVYGNYKPSPYGRIRGHIVSVHKKELDEEVTASSSGALEIIMGPKISKEESAESFVCEVPSQPESSDPSDLPDWFEEQMNKDGGKPNPPIPFNAQRPDKKYQQKPFRKVMSHKLLDATKELYELQGIRFQGVGEHFQCLKCDTLCLKDAPSLSSRKRSAKSQRFVRIRRHILNFHSKGRQPCKAVLIDKESQTYIYNNYKLRELEDGFECQDCKANFSLWSGITRHINVVHRDLHRGVCPICNLESKNLRHHIAFAHPNDSAKVVCELCGKECKTKAHLYNHQASHKYKDQAEYPHECELCGKKYPSPSTLAQHINSFHLGLKSFMCDQCGKSFSKKTALTKHLVVHTKEKKYRCPHCGKLYPYSNGLKRHIRAAHEGYRRPYIFACSVCSRPFQTKYNLQAHHREVHLGIRPPPRNSKRTQNSGLM